MWFKKSPQHEDHSDYIRTFSSASSAIPPVSYQTGFNWFNVLIVRATTSNYIFLENLYYAAEYSLNADPLIFHAANGRVNIPSDYAINDQNSANSGFIFFNCNVHYQKIGLPIAYSNYQRTPNFNTTVITLIPHPLADINTIRFFASISIRYKK